MEPDEATHELAAMMRLRGLRDATPEHTGGNVWVVRVDMPEGYIWASPDGPDGGIIAGHYGSDTDEEPAHGWLPGLEPNPEGPPVYTAATAAALVAQYVEVYALWQQRDA